MPLKRKPLDRICKGTDMVRPPVFDPPYESPVEERFAWTFHKLLRLNCDFSKQVPVETSHGRFRVDFVITSPTGLRLGIELDGKRYHDRVADSWRDSLILGGRHLDSILRFAAKDVHYRLFDTIAIIKELYPIIFHPDRVIAVERLSSEGLADQIHDMPEHVYVLIEDEVLDDGSPIDIIVSHEGHTEHSSKTWRRRFDFACAHPRTPFSELEATYQHDAV